MQTLIDHFVERYKQENQVLKVASKTLELFAAFVNAELERNPPAAIQPDRVVFRDGSEVTLGGGAQMPVDSTSISVFGMSNQDRRASLPVDNSQAVQLFGEQADGE